MANNNGLLTTSKRLFLRGLGALLPTLITIVILTKLVQFLYNSFGQYISLGLIELVVWLTGNQAHREELAASWQMPVIGFLVAAVFVCVIGLLLASFIGRRLWRMVEAVITSIPLVKQIYPYVKQVTDYVFGERRMDFSQVVAVQYPRKGIWSVGFVTGPPIRDLGEMSDGLMTVFIPSSPTPFTGYVITVPREDAVDLSITIDQALRYIVSGGVITPGIEIAGLAGCASVEKTPGLPTNLNTAGRPRDGSDQTGAK